MKKFLCLMILSLMLVGCGKKEQTAQNKEEPIKKEEQTKKSVVLDCSKFTKSSIDFTTNMIYYYENDEFQRLGVKYTYDLSKYTDAQKKAFADSKVCESDALKDKLGISECKEELVGNDYIVTGFAEKLYEEARKDKYEDIKDYYNNNGWNCILK